LDRHVAIDAVGGDLLSNFTKHSALLDLMTLEAARGIIGGGSLGSVRVMASGTRHCRRGLKTTAARQEIDLIAVNIQAVCGVWLLQFDIFGERLSRPEGKRWSDGLAGSAVALGADVNLAIT
jgi:hypothetical protein